MRKAIILAGLALLIIPAAASARTPVRGGEKLTIVQSYVLALSLDADQRQMATCFDVYTDAGYAFVTVANRPSLFRSGGLCGDIKAYYGGKLQIWQPDLAILKRVGQGWRLKVQFDGLVRGQPSRYGIPLSVFVNLTHSKPIR